MTATKVSEAERQLQLQSQTVSDFYAHLFSTLEELDIFVHINEHPNEMPDALPFTKGEIHAAYDPLNVGVQFKDKVGDLSICALLSVLSHSDLGARRGPRLATPRHLGPRQTKALR
ncbi:DUF5996 family protein [Methylocystis hirsuta]|uniref:Uncharacterized protein n=1 Tax=Methylocystis hirsuta TaxID=369798 RepID=A0A3M9XPJ6_9HYPH|nr:DUF5996 family protein [Methylocystis hirsuta]RNJ49672.1 hypothetical protein D1O30_08720 [Methylocystis hirsuta]